MSDPTSENLPASRFDFWLEPYRMFFLWGATHACAFFIMWGLRLLSIEGTLPPFAASFSFPEHAHTLIWGIWGAYVFGFSLTAYPKQNNGAPLALGRLKALFALFVLSQVLLCGAWVIGISALAVPGKIAEALSYCGLLAYLVPIGIAELRRQFWWQPLGVLVGLGTGTGALLVHSFAPPQIAWAALRVGLWAYLFFLIASFAHRVVPFFTSRVVPEYNLRRGPAFLPVLFVLLAVLVGAEAVHHQLGISLASAALFLWCGREWSLWGPVKGSRIPMIGILHLAWFWLMLALLLGALSGLTAIPVNQLHLFTVGTLITFILGISTRVTLGHGGRPIAFGKAGGVVVVIAQLALLLRVFATPVFGNTANPAYLNAAAAFTLSAAFALWLVRFGPYLVLTKIPPAKVCPK